MWPLQNFKCVQKQYTSSIADTITYPVALDTALSILLLVATDADRFLVTWYKSLGSNWLPTDLAAEALLVERFALEFVFFHTFRSQVQDQNSVDQLSPTVDFGYLTPKAFSNRPTSTLLLLSWEESNEWCDLASVGLFENNNCCSKTADGKRSIPGT